MASVLVESDEAIELPSKVLEGAVLDSEGRRRCKSGPIMQIKINERMALHHRAIVGGLERVHTDIGALGLPKASGAGRLPDAALLEVVEATSVIKGRLDD